MEIVSISTKKGWMMMNVLLVGESWMKHTIHVKGFDSFTTSEYEEGASWFQKAMAAGDIALDYIRAHEIEEKFPDTLEKLKQYDAVLLSDIGSNTFLLSSKTFNHSERSVNRLDLIEDYTASGGGFGMIGGYLSFQGIDAKAKFKGTSIEQILPVTLETGDDRVEIPEGGVPQIKNTHSIIQGIPEEWPVFLGYNKVNPKKESVVVAEIGRNSDPFLVTGEYKNGRTLAFTSDMAPHWGPMEFVEWEYYQHFWQQLVKWLGKENV